MATESFFSNASLAYLASAGAGKDGKAYSIKPTDGTGDFTFSRGSNLAATRVGADGLIEKGRENLVTQSNDLSSFTPNGLTTTPNQEDPFGGNNATLFTENLSGGNHRFYLLGVPSSSAVHTYSMYVKYNGRTRFKLVINGGNPNATFNTQTGAHITDSGNIIDYKTESIGNDWHRVSFASVCSGWVGGYFVNDSGQDSYTGDGTSGVVLFGAQVEIGLAATDYIESGATTGKAGLLEDEPRFDYSGGATCPSLLLEPSRTNRCTSSEYFEGAAWLSVGSPTITTNYGISPEGIQNSTRIVFSAANECIYDGIAYTSEEVSTIYVKGTSGETIKFGKGDNIFVGTLFTLDGTWQRLEFVQSVSGNTFTINTSGGATARDIEIWGAQNEEGSYPTSYIPNHSGGSVTRGAEGQSYGGFSSLIGQTEGTLFLDIENAENDTEIFSLNRSTANAIFLWSVSNVYDLYIYSDGTTYGPGTSISVNDRIKIAIAYQSNNFAVYANGVQVSTNNSLTWTPNITIDSLNFNVGGYISSKGAARFNQVLIIPERISNTDLATLTTI